MGELTSIWALRSLLELYFVEEGMGQWREHSPSTNVARFNSWRRMWVEFAVGSVLFIRWYGSSGIFFGPYLFFWIGQPSNVTLPNTIFFFLFFFLFQVHLFDIDVPGKIRFQESEVLSPGNQLTMMDTCKNTSLRLFLSWVFTDWFSAEPILIYLSAALCKIGIGICYDMRFPEMAQVYTQQGKWSKMKDMRKTIRIPFPLMAQYIACHHFIHTCTLHQQFHSSASNIKKYSWWRYIVV